jgi:small subunit ribosomal protein S4
MDNKVTIEKKAPEAAVAVERKQQPQQQQKRGGRKLSEYGKQLHEKQKVKEMYGMRERQFRIFFANALKMRAGATGENLLNMLECRLDNAVYRLKFASTRAQARQVVVHGHILVNSKKVYSPSYRIVVGDVITLADNVLNKTAFVEQVIDKRLKMGIKVPEWLELDKVQRTGKVLRLPVRADIQVPVEEHLIVELYSK